MYCAFKSEKTNNNIINEITVTDSVVIVLISAISPKLSNLILLNVEDLIVGAL